LDFLPRKTRTKLRNPTQKNGAADDELVACIFWFQNEDQYETLLKETSTMCVRSKDFQIRFSELSVGCIILPNENVVNSDEEQAISQTEKQYKKYHTSIDYGELPGMLRDFFVLTKSSEI